jgi:hypothetical protein
VLRPKARDECALTIDNGNGQRDQIGFDGEHWRLGDLLRRCENAHAGGTDQRREGAEASHDVFLERRGLAMRCRQTAPMFG